MSVEIKYVGLYLSKLLYSCIAALNHSKLILCYKCKQLLSYGNYEGTQYFITLVN